MPRFALACALLFSLSATAATPALSPVERRISEAADARREAGIALLGRLVEQNSGTYNHAGVEAVAGLLRPELEALGFTVEWKPMAQTGRAGHLVATHAGNGKGKRMLLIGHLDTVFEADSAFTGFRIEGGRAIGPGVGDDKGGVAVMLLALGALHDAGALRDADITVVLTGDEEDVGQPVAQARADLIDAGKTRLSASGKDNVVPPVALARGDFRTLSAEQTQRVGAKMRAIVESGHLPRTDATLEIEENYPPMAPTAGNRALLAKLNEVNRDLGLEQMGELDPRARGAGDISFVAADVDGLVGMGASGGNSHAEGEYVELDSLPRQARRAALLMHRLAQTPR